MQCGNSLINLTLRFFNAEIKTRDVALLISDIPSMSASAILIRLHLALVWLIVPYPYGFLLFVLSALGWGLRSSPAVTLRVEYLPPAGRKRLDFTRESW